MVVWMPVYAAAAAMAHTGALAPVNDGEALTAAAEAQIEANDRIFVAKEGEVKLRPTALATLRRTGDWGPMSTESRQRALRDELQQRDHRWPAWVVDTYVDTYMRALLAEVVTVMAALRAPASNPDVYRRVGPMSSLELMEHLKTVWLDRLVALQDVKVRPSHVLSLPCLWERGGGVFFSRQNKVLSWGARHSVPSVLSLLETLMKEDWPRDDFSARDVTHHLALLDNAGRGGARAPAQQQRPPRQQRRDRGGDRGCNRDQRRGGGGGNWHPRNRGGWQGGRSGRSGNNQRRGPVPLREFHERCAICGNPAHLAGWHQTNRG